MPEIIWASSAAESALATPSADKQAEGWGLEAPAFEFMNWLQNRTDRRLNKLEEPWTHTVHISPANAREAVIPAGERYACPQYVVGARQLRVYLEGIPCTAGENAQYMEVGLEGQVSTNIRWNDDIDPEYEVRIEAPIRATELVSFVNVTLEDVTTEIVSTMANAALQLHVKQEVFDSPADTRDAVIPANTDFTVSEYTVGESELNIHKDGVKLMEGVDYIEIGEAGSTSTTIQFTDPVEIADSLSIVSSIRATGSMTVYPEESTNVTAVVEDVLAETGVSTVVEKVDEALAVAQEAKAIAEGSPIMEVE